jgi:peptide/nickel transport system ATP-binding protein
VTPLLEVSDLGVSFYTRRGTVHAVRGVSFRIEPRETLGLVGESGSGKSVTMKAVLGLIDLPGRITAGEVLWKGESLLHGPRAQARLRSIRGKEMTVVFQDPMTSLNPLFTIGTQISEVLRHHMGMSKRAATDRVLDLLGLVGMSYPRQRFDQYPHEFSGGMRQRAMIAMALACEPELLIADEPTTALDVTIQAQILELIGDLQSRLGLAVILITHDLAVVAGICHRVHVMYGGKLVEHGPANELFARPAHPYTVGLLDSTPRLDVVVPRLQAIDGSPPDLREPPPGCPFAPRCAIAVDRCTAEMPALADVAPGRTAACWLPFTAGRSVASA